ncbi:MAG: hypothetical protein ACLFQL_07400 [Paracoccaceae bacterium]
MILKTSGETGSPLEDEIASIGRQLREARHDLEALQASLREGVPGSEAQGSKTIASIKQWIRLAIEAEMLLATRNRNRSGSARGDFALDLDAARREIGDRLDRLRRARAEDDLSG